jgi:hypothetical protein
MLEGSVVGGTVGVNVNSGGSVVDVMVFGWSVGGTVGVAVGVGDRHCPLTTFREGGTNIAPAPDVLRKHPSNANANV